VERVAIVAREWERCLAAGWEITTYPARVALDAVQARAAVVWSVLGIPLEEAGRTSYLYTPTGEPSKRKQRIARRGWKRPAPDVDLEAARLVEEGAPQDVAAAALERWGMPLPVGHVIALRVAGLREFYRRLRARGQVPLARHWEVEMVEPIVKPWDLDGWKDIAAALGVGIRTAQEWAEREADKLPVSMVAGRARANRAELEAWLHEEFRRGKSA